MFNIFRSFFLLEVLSSNLYSYLIKYPTPININYFWNFGILAGFFLAIQIVSGFILTMSYTPHIDYAFNSIEHIMRDIRFGWLIRYIHANGASFFFLIIYIHIGKAIYYGSYQYPRHMVWFTGVIIYVLLIGTAFLGYVLPWGQMSYWAATVITNMVTVIPFVGKQLVYWIWGGFSINNATLNRFYSLHFILPFVIAFLAIYHLYQLHKVGSGNELGTKTFKYNKINFLPYYVVKDALGVIIIVVLFCIFVFFFPESLGHSDNYIEANPLVTPSHIVPEWYFLPLYGILRSILNKTYGLIVMFLSIVVLLLLPLLDTIKIRSKKFRSFHKIMVGFFFFNFIFLGFLGSQTPISPFIEFGVIATHIHLLYFFLYIVLSSLYSSYNNIIFFKKKKVKPFIHINYSYVYSY